MRESEGGKERVLSEKQMSEHCGSFQWYILISVFAALTHNNVKEMLDVAWESRARWRFIGIELGIDTGTLDAIEHDKRKAEDCLSELISQWLRRSDPKPTRRAMTKALKAPSVAASPSVSLNPALPVCEGVLFCFVVA